MIKYETLFILKPDLSEEEIEGVLRRLEDCIGRTGGRMAVINHWGSRELAYAVRYRGVVLRRGYYVLLTYVGNGATVAEVERNLKILDQSFRYLTVKLEKGVDPAEIQEVVVLRQGPTPAVLRREAPVREKEGEEAETEVEAEASEEGELEEEKEEEKPGEDWEEQREEEE